MERELIENFLNKHVLVSTTSGATLEGNLEYNNTKHYPEEPYIIATDTDYTYYVGPTNVNSIVEWNHIKGE